MKKILLSLIFICIAVFTSGNHKTYISGNSHQNTSPNNYINAIDTLTFKDQIQKPYYLRIPFAEVTNKGTLIVGADIRENTTADQTKISIGIVRSTDKGRTFTNPQIIIPHTEISDWDRAMDGTILINRKNGDIFVFAHRIISKNIWEHTHHTGEYGFDCFVTKSSDDGKTWSKPISLKKEMGSFGENVISLFGGVGNGITMEDGTLVLPIQCKMATQNISATNENDIFNIQSGLLYSKDGGKTWKRSATLLPCYSSECNLIEYKSGKLMINSRGYISKRRIFVTDNLGSTWFKAPADCTLVEPVACQGSFHKIKYKRHSYGLFINPRDSVRRKNITLYKTMDYLNYSPLYTLEKKEIFGYSTIADDENNVYIGLEDNGYSIRIYTFSKKDL